MQELSVAFAASATKPSSIVSLARLTSPSLNPRIICHPRIRAGLVTGKPNVNFLRAGAHMEEFKWGRRKGIKQARNADGGKLWVGMASSGNSDDLPETVVKKMGEGGSSIVLEPDFRLALSVLAIGLQLWKVLEWTTLGIFITIIGGFLTMQTARLRFRFTSSTLDVLRVHGLSDSGNDDGQSAYADARGKDDVMRKTTTRAIGPWAFSSVVNWEFWWPGFPVLAYFKETQVKETGQRHFIPIIMDGKALYEQMYTNFGQSLTPKPPASEWQHLQPLHPRGYAYYKHKTIARITRLAAQLRLEEHLRVVFIFFSGLRDEKRRQAALHTLGHLLMRGKAWAESRLQEWGVLTAATVVEKKKKI